MKSFELIPPGTNIDFLGKRRICGAISAALLLVSLGALFIRGPQLGIDFAGGTEVQVRFAPDAGVDEGAIRSVVTACGVRDPSVVRYGEEGASEFLIRFRQETVAGEGGAAPADCPLSEAERERLAQVAQAAGGDADSTGGIVDRLSLALAGAVAPLDVQRVEYVGPRVGAELRRDGISSLAIACALILVYVAFRFSTRFAPGAVIALVHDVGITAGVFVIFGLEFDLRVLAALLAILGYSLNDTIIIYDRIRENMALRTTFDLVEVLNRSVNQTLSRTVLTSGTTLAAVLALLLLGGEVMRPFAIAMVIGIFVGTYSSVFIAAPTLLFLERRFGSGQDETGSTRKPPQGGRAPRSEKRGKRARNKATA